MAIGILRALRDHAVVAGLSVHAVAAPRRSCAIDTDHGVVDERRCAGPELDRPDEAMRRQRGRQHQVSKHIAIAGTHDVLAWCDHDIRLTELPAVRPDWNAREIRRVALNRALASPSAGSLQSQRAEDAARR